MNSTNVIWPLMIAALLPWACIAVFALITPRLTRPDLFFAVTVKPSFRVSPAAGEIVREYNRIILAVALLGLLPIGLIIFIPRLAVIGLLAPTFIEIAGCFGAFLAARQRAMAFHVEPTTEREAELAPRQVSLPGGWLAQSGPFLVLAAACVCLWMNWDRIPARVPIHWGATGAPDGWAAKSLASVFGSTAIGIMICLLLAGICRGVLGGVRRIHSSGRAGLREARFVRAISYFLLGMEYWLALLMGLISLAALRRHPEAPLQGFWVILLGQTIMVGSIFLIAWRMGQGGWRAYADGEMDKPAPDAPPVGDRTPDECWKLGVFYCNRNDPALFVEKRFGVGWTFNFANPRSWIVLGVILLFVLATLGVSIAMTHGNVTAR